LAGARFFGGLFDCVFTSRKMQAADAAMKIILAYLLIGSHATLFWLWRQKRKTPPLTPLTESTV
jgi:hypothetical protein